MPWCFELLYFFYDNIRPSTWGGVGMLTFLELAHMLGALSVIAHMLDASPVMLLEFHISNEK